MTIEQAFEALAEELSSLDGYLSGFEFRSALGRALAKAKAEGEPAVKCHQLHAMAGSNKCLATTAEECRCQRENHPPGTNHQWPCRTTAPAAHPVGGAPLGGCARCHLVSWHPTHRQHGLESYHAFVPPPEPKPVAAAPTTTSAAGWLRELANPDNGDVDMLPDTAKRLRAIAAAIERHENAAHGALKELEKLNTLPAGDWSPSVFFAMRALRSSLADGGGE